MFLRFLYRTLTLELFKSLEKSHVFIIIIIPILKAL